MTGEPMHTASEMTPCTPAYYRLKSKVSIMLRCQLCSTHYTAFRIKNCSIAPLQSMHTERNGATHPSYINYNLKSEVSIMFCCRLCSTCHTAS